MAKKKSEEREVEKWITINGKHVPVYKGESKAELTFGNNKDKKEEHYDTKLNDIWDRLKKGEITPKQAKDESYEYEKSQRGNKRWSDLDTNRIESKVRDIFKDANEIEKNGEVKTVSKMSKSTKEEKMVLNHLKNIVFRKAIGSDGQAEISKEPIKGISQQKFLDILNKNDKTYEYDITHDTSRYMGMTVHHYYLIRNKK